MGLAQKARLDAYATQALLDAAFHRGPVWRERFDQHVQDWKRNASRDCFTLYHTSPSFAAAHDARIAALRAETMPAWGGRKQ